MYPNTFPLPFLLPNPVGASDQEASEVEKAPLAS